MTSSKAYLGGAVEPALLRLGLDGAAAGPHIIGVSVSETIAETTNRHAQRDGELAEQAGRRCRP